MRSTVLSGFNFLSEERISLTGWLRRLLFGVTLGGVLAWFALWPLRQDMAQEQERQAKLKADIRATESTLQEAMARAAAAQTRREQGMQLRAWQAERQQLLAWMETLARSSGVQLTQLRLEGASVSLHGLIPAGPVHAWAASVGPPGAGAPRLLEIGSEPASAGQLQRFALRWPLAGQAQP